MSLKRRVTEAFPFQPVLSNNLFRLILSQTNDLVENNLICS